MRNILLAAIASVGLIGCVGGIESGGGGDLPPPPNPTTGDDGNDDGNNPAGGDLTAAKQVFDQKVFTLIQKCGGAACHAENGGASVTRFVATDAARGWQVAVGYSSLVGNFTPAGAGIITYVKPSHPGNGTTWQPAEEAAITEWLAAEAAARNGQPTTPTQPGAETLSQATERVMRQFNGCMELADFQAVNFGQAWANTGSDEGDCVNCHVNGGEGIMTNPNATTMYNIHSTRKYFFLQYFTVDLTMGAAAAKVIVNETSFRGVSQGQYPHLEHPRFNALNNNGMTQLKAFHARIQNKITTNTCGQPKAFTM